ncbi:MAG: hypothetical protein RL291_351, partial [Pseudomonadota bacterium]
MTEPCHLSAVEARKLIGKKKLSPVELLDSCLEQIARTNPAVNAFVAMDTARAKKAAKAAEAQVMDGDELGPIHGLPVGIKDLEATKGLRTTWGSPIFKDEIPKADTAAVARVREAGGIVIGKTNVPEFGAGGNTTNPVYGPTKNPFDHKLTSSGSSGGSAVALALDMVPIATGSDYGGSLRTPASFCGVVGIRPSPGVIGMSEKQAALIPWGVLGPMARTVDDALLLLRAQMGFVRADPFSAGQTIKLDKLKTAELSKLRIAVTPDLGVAPVSNAVRAAFDARLKILKRATKTLGKTQPDFSGVHEVFDVLRAVAMVTNQQTNYRTKRDLLGPNVRHDYEVGLKLTAEEIGRAMLEQQKLVNRVNAFFDDWDVLVAPAASVRPFPHGQLFVSEMDGRKLDTYMRWLSLTYATTMALC